MQVGDIYQRKSGPLVEVRGIDEMFVAFTYGGEQTYFLGHDEFERRFAASSVAGTINDPGGASLSQVIDRPAPARHGDWMQTFSGRMFWPLDPRADEIDINDIAHALSMQCRYAGHCTRFYSVAEHCVLLAGAVEEHHALWALLHDASEAYLVDVPRPVKPFLSGYREAETRVMTAIAERFGLGPMPDEVKDADNRILEDERRQIMAPPPRTWSNTGLPLGVTLRCWEPERAKRAFLSAFRLHWQNHQQREGGR